MISTIFHALIYDPLYNGLVFLVGVMPSHDVGVAVIMLTIVVRIILFPLSRRATETQRAMKKIAPEVEEIKKKHEDKQEQAKAIFALYRERGVRPFAGVGLLLAQLPVLFALYWIFALGGLPEIRPELLYAFVSSPPFVGMEFLGILDMAGHSIVLGVLAAATQFAYTRLSMGAPSAPSAGGKPGSFSGDLARSFDLQARYVLPATFVVLSFFIPSAAMLYLVTSNAFMIGQELFSGRRF